MAVEFAVDATVALAGPGAQGQHGGRVTEIEVEFARDRRPQLRSLHPLDQRPRGRAEPHRLGWKRAAPAQPGKIGDNLPEREARHEIGYDDVRERRRLHLGMSELFEVEADSGEGRRVGHWLILSLLTSIPSSTNGSNVEPSPRRAPHTLPARSERAIWPPSMDTHVAPTQTTVPTRTAQGPLPAYRAKVASGDLIPDPAQDWAAERLQALWLRLRGYDPPPHPPASETLLGRLFGRKPVDEMPEQHPGGVYLVGPVGRGKSMLLDLFFAAALVPRKKRLHFFAFMRDVHARLFAIRQTEPGRADPIQPLADAIAAEAALICFDEFQINDIADAMLLGRLFEALFARGVVIVATSNVVPDDLFKGQPGRDAFLPFIALIKRQLDTVLLDGGADYRRGHTAVRDRWIVPADARAYATLTAAFIALTEGAPAASCRLSLIGRSLDIPLAARGVARFDFAQLCRRNLGAPDYLALATHFRTLVVDRIPIMSPDEPDVARRFATLIDALYDHRVKLIASAEAQPDDIFPGGSGVSEFERTASRLHDMRRQSWIDLPHLT